VQLCRNVVSFFGQTVLLLLVFIYIVGSTFIFNIFFQCWVPPARLSPFRLDDLGSPASNDLSGVFRVGVGIRLILWATLRGCPVPLQALTSQSKLEPTCLVNRILASFPTGRKRFYKVGLPFPTGRKASVTGFRFSTHRSHSHPGWRRVKNVQAPDRRFHLRPRTLPLFRAPKRRVRTFQSIF
jgi:hypothetical protein